MAEGKRGPGRPPKTVEVPKGQLDEMRELMEKMTAGYEELKSQNESLQKQLNKSRTNPSQAEIQRRRRQSTANTLATVRAVGEVVHDAKWRPLPPEPISLLDNDREDNAATEIWTRGWENGYNMTYDQVVEILSGRADIPPPSGDEIAGMTENELHAAGASHSLPQVEAV